MAYPTLDYLPLLTAAEITGARHLTFSPYSGASTSWDSSAAAYGSESYAILHAVYAFDATAGATYDFFSTSYFDPFILEVFDRSGRVVAANSESDDGPNILLDGAYYSDDIIWDWVAPYTGTFYLNASWNQGSYYKFYAINVYEDTGSTQNVYSSSGDQIWGGVEGDYIYGKSGSDTIIALDGNDLVHGGAGNDDVNGNVGTDLVSGDDGNDSVRGGRGDDTVMGLEGDDPHVNGNIGNDAVLGGNGADTLYGGQDNDTLSGEAGNDLLSGDLGNDALFGGAGADRFTTRLGGGVDWIGDFSQAEGDRIQLAPGTAYTLTSYQGQVIIDLGDGTQLGLAGVGSVSGDWLLLA